jgi:hypothetical protein
MTSSIIHLCDESDDSLRITSVEVEVHVITCIKNIRISVKVTQKEFEDTKGAIRIRISKKNRQHNGQKKKYKRTQLVFSGFSHQ